APSAGQLPPPPKLDRRARGSRSIGLADGRAAAGRSFSHSTLTNVDGFRQATPIDILRLIGAGAMSETREAVHSRYMAAARQLTVLASTGATLEPGCCQADGPECGCAGTYSVDELREVGLTDGISLGCGNPLLLADLHPGEAVLDLGSGGGLDVLLSARRVAPAGVAYGVDMTDEMLEVANSNKARAGVENATFLKGTIEEIPLPDNSVDVVISNCVINLAEEKGA